jgi:uncharacterized protein (TIGR03435 family)
MSRALAALSLVATVTLAQAPEPAPRFDVADVHRSLSTPNPYTWASGGNLRGSRYDFRKASMIDLIRQAYAVDPGIIVGGPNWLEFDRFDIAAKAPPNASPATIRLMLQNLLADRFKLVLRKDLRPMPAFALAVGKAKPRLKQSDGMGDSGCTYQPQPPGSTLTVYACRNISMEVLAANLRSFAGDYLTVPVLNTAGLDSTYDFDLKWNRRSQVLPTGTERITIFDAIEKQLGMTLAPVTAPASVVVIEHVNENPSPNPPDVAGKLPPREVEFEVADLKMNKSDEPGNISATPGGGFEARNQALKILLATGWDLDWDHVDKGFANLPGWTDEARLDIHAQPPSHINGPAYQNGGFLDDDLRLMLRNLLIERFQRKTHIENRPMDAYTLVASKPKLRKADPSNRANCKDSRTIANDPRDVNPRLARLIACQNVTMAQFAAELHRFAADYILYDVADATGLSGAYDFTLSYSPRYLLRQSGPEGSDPTGAVSLQDAISKQLGLKLELRQRPLPVIVIDHMEEKPLEN